MNTGITIMVAPGSGAIDESTDKLIAQMKEKGVAQAHIDFVDKIIRAMRHQMALTADIGPTTNTLAVNAAASAIIEARHLFAAADEGNDNFERGVKYCQYLLGQIVEVVQTDLNIMYPQESGQRH